MGKSRRSSRVFTENEMKQLEANPKVQHVTDRTITYAPAFKLAAVKAYEDGQKPMEIFLQAGFDVDTIGHKNPKRSLQRWCEQYMTRGEAGLLEDQRGKTNDKEVIRRGKAKTGRSTY
jgi:transposase